MGGARDNEELLDAGDARQSADIRAVMHHERQVLVKTVLQTEVDVPAVVCECL